MRFEYNIDTDSEVEVSEIANSEFNFDIWCSCSLAGRVCGQDSMCVDCSAFDCDLSGGVY